MGFSSIAILASSVVSLLLGLFVYFSGKNKRINFAFTLLSFSIAGWCFAQFLGGMAVEKSQVLYLTRLNLAFAILIPAFYLFFILNFCENEKNNKPLLRLVFIIAGLLLISDATPWFVADVSKRFSIGYYPVPGPAYAFFAGYLFILFGEGFRRLYFRLRSAEKELVNQAKYVFLASLVGLLGGAADFLPVYNIDFPIISHFAIPACLAIIAYSIVKHKLLDIDIVIREGLVYSFLTVIFTAFYALVILFASRFFQDITRLDIYAVAVIVIFASIMIFQPIRNLIQQWVDRLFFRGSYYYQKKISDLSNENLKLYRTLLRVDKLAALGTIAAGMAHEIKNPLASIKGLTQVLPENIADPEFIQKYYQIVPRQLDRINRIVEDLLAFGHPAKMEMREVELQKVMDDVLRLFENQCCKAGIEIKRDYQAKEVILADEEKLSQAFVNIILNAIQAMPKGGELMLTTLSGQLTTIIEISDMGEGIPPEELSQVFDPFYTTKENGTGMGLAVTYRIIHEHNGEIEVESEIGKGTTFKICLPIKQKPSA